MEIAMEQRDDYDISSVRKNCMIKNNLLPIRMLRILWTVSKLERDDGATSTHIS